VKKAPRMPKSQGLRPLLAATEAQIQMQNTASAK
jgi:hypothetical protein